MVSSALTATSWLLTVVPSEFTKDRLPIQDDVPSPVIDMFTRMIWPVTTPTGANVYCWTTVATGLVCATAMPHPIIKVQITLGEMWRVITRPPHRNEPYRTHSVAAARPSMHC